MTDKSKNALANEASHVNPVLASLDPSTFEVSAKKNSTMWHTEQYKDAEFRNEIVNTCARIEQSKLPE